MHTLVPRGSDVLVNQAPLGTCRETRIRDTHPGPEGKRRCFQSSLRAFWQYATTLRALRAFWSHVNILRENLAEFSSNGVARIWSLVTTLRKRSFWSHATTLRGNPAGFPSNGEVRFLVTRDHIVRPARIFVTRVHFARESRVLGCGQGLCLV